jgi:NADPH:quinone reductase-like Zn-dependent oxidoreductase
LFLHALGAAEVISYQHEDFASRVGEFDVVLDLVGGRTQDRSWQVLRPGGVLVSVVAPPDQERARAAGTRGLFFIVRPDRRQLESIARLVDMGRLTPVVDRVMSLEDSRAAYELLETEHHRGKVVIHVAD